jgi:hypothetical protein
LHSLLVLQPTTVSLGVPVQRPEENFTVLAVRALRDPHLPVEGQIVQIPAVGLLTENGTNPLRKLGLIARKGCRCQEV